MVEKDVRITFRIPVTLRDLVRKYIELDAHMNESDFYRDAAREKIQRDAPELYKKLFEAMEKEPKE
jgi:Arc/MetJ-type ribon-helix-helix transcriptional regulator